MPDRITIYRAARSARLCAPRTRWSSRCGSPSSTRSATTSASTTTGSTSSGYGLSRLRHRTRGRFPRKLLNEGEEIVLDLRPHWWFMAEPTAALLGSIVLGIVVLRGDQGRRRRGRPGRPRRRRADRVLPRLVPRALRSKWVTTNFVVTTDRVVYRHGVLAKHGIEIPLEKINTVFFNQSIFERMLGAGDLAIESAGERGSRDLHRHPQAVDRAERDLQADGGEREPQVRPGRAGPSTTRSRPSPATRRAAAVDPRADREARRAAPPRGHLRRGVRARRRPSCSAACDAAASSASSRRSPRRCSRGASARRRDPLLRAARAAARSAAPRTPTSRPSWPCRPTWSCCATRRTAGGRRRARGRGRRGPHVVIRSVADVGPSSTASPARLGVARSGRLATAPATAGRRRRAFVPIWRRPWMTLTPTPTASSRARRHLGDRQRLRRRRRSATPRRPSTRRRHAAPTSSSPRASRTRSGSATWRSSNESRRSRWSTARTCSGGASAPRREPKNGHRQASRTPARSTSTLTTTRFGRSKSMQRPPGCR